MFNCYLNAVKSLLGGQTHVVQHSVQKRFISFRLLSNVLFSSSELLTELRTLLKIMTIVETHLLNKTYINGIPLRITARSQITLYLFRCNRNHMKYIFKNWYDIQVGEETA